MKTAVVVDYGAGNIGSISNFLRNFEFKIEVCKAAKSMMDADLVVLPGVGSFGPAKLNLDFANASQAIIDRSRAGKPILGICLGFQLMTISSQESEGIPGLGLFRATTKRLIDGPVIGWAETVPSKASDSSIQSYYFNHSFGVFGSPDFDDYTLSGKETYVAYARKDKLVGTQFHPEKSQQAGIDFFTKILNECWQELK